jgi:hypothetical protein
MTARNVAKPASGKRKKKYRSGSGADAMCLSVAETDHWLKPKPQTTAKATIAPNAAILADIVRRLLARSWRADTARKRRRMLRSLSSAPGPGRTGLGAGRSCRRRQLMSVPKEAPCPLQLSAAGRSAARLPAAHYIVRTASTIVPKGSHHCRGGREGPQQPRPCVLRPFETFRRVQFGL